MDRREALLREMNLYPLWGRRDLPAAAPAGLTPEQTLPPEVEPVASESLPALETVAAATNIADELPVFFEAANSLQHFDSTHHSSLRAFQEKVAAGPWAECDLPQLKQAIRDCQACGLRAGCTQPVAGSGNEQADWMLIGEAPGAEEDARGDPFVGHAGRLLDNMLNAIKLKREQVYITNVIKCRPPDDRHPHVGEIDACLPYLKRQIELVQPKLIVALGKTAASALLETDASIASLRGRVHGYKGIALVVTFHPAYLLRSPLEKEKAWQDLCLALDTIKS